MFFDPLYLLALIVVLTFHECSHAWVATRLGDPTAERAGRLTLNPLRHLDLVGTLMLFFAGMGWGKPVPVNPRNFAHPIRDEAFTALAGPGANLVMAFITGVLVHYLSVESGFFAFSNALMDLSIVLFLFNMLPFPPLDGSKFYVLFLPRRFQARYHEFLDRSMPYFIVLMIVDLYFLPSVLGFSLVWTAITHLTFWLKAAILVIV